MFIIQNRQIVFEKKFEASQTVLLKTLLFAFLLKQLLEKRLTQKVGNDFFNEMQNLKIRKQKIEKLEKIAEQRFLENSITFF